jgi:hypothetical protein
VTVGAGSGHATLQVCGGFDVEVPAASQVLITCGSVVVQVIQGSATVVLGDGLTTVSIPQGVKAEVSQDADGRFDVQDLGGGSVTVTVDGAQTVVAANTTKTVSAWDFRGFSSPVDNPTILNVVKAGQAVPFKWRLVHADGTPVTNLSSAKLTASSLSCSLGSTPDLLEEVAAGASGLQNLGNGYYQLNWRSPNTYAGSCKALHLDLGEGVTRDAYFQFKK